MLPDRKPSVPSRILAWDLSSQTHMSIFGAVVAGRPPCTDDNSGLFFLDVIHGCLSSSKTFFLCSSISFSSTSSVPLSISSLPLYLPITSQQLFDLRSGLWVRPVTLDHFFLQWFEIWFLFKDRDHVQNGRLLFLR